MDKINTIRKQLIALERQYAPVITSQEQLDDLLYEFTNPEYLTFDCPEIEVDFQNQNLGNKLNQWDFTKCTNITFKDMFGIYFMNETCRYVPEIHLKDCEHFGVFAEDGMFNFKTMKDCKSCTIASFDMDNIFGCDNCDIQAEYMNSITKCDQTFVRIVDTDRSYTINVNNSNQCKFEIQNEYVKLEYSECKNCIN